MRRALVLPLVLLALARPASSEVIAHEFSGVITSVYDGMTGAAIAFPELQVGDSFTGCFSYDTSSTDQFPDPILGRYAGPSHRWVYESAAFSMTGSEVSSDVALFPHAESVSATAGQASLPIGWSSPASVSDSFSVILQNVPSLGVLATDALPPTIDLAQWVSFRELRLDFYDGVTSPTATTTQRLVVQGEILTLGLAAPGSPCRDGGGGGVESECPSSGAWSSHGEYVSCVARATQDRVRDGLMTRGERQAALTAAAQSEIGK